jgi:hypothetical protein
MEPQLVLKILASEVCLLFMSLTMAAIAGVMEWLPAVILISICVTLLFYIWS